MTAVVGSAQLPEIVIGIANVETGTVIRRETVTEIGRKNATAKKTEIDMGIDIAETTRIIPVMPGKIAMVVPLRVVIRQLSRIPVYKLDLM